MTVAPAKSPERIAVTDAEARRPDFAEMAARLRLGVLRLSRKIRQQVPQEVTQSQVSVLVSVERQGNPTLGELAAAEQVRPPSMTRQVDALVSAGLLSRTVDPGDRRVVRVQLTSAGRRALQRSRSLRAAYLVKRLTKLTPAEQAMLPELVGLLEKLAGLE
jgi:DNA-binding MarR family transcriptional regulator